MTLTSEILVARILGPLQRSSQAAMRRLGAEIALKPEQAADDPAGAGPGQDEWPGALVIEPAQVPPTPARGGDAWAASGRPSPGGTVEPAGGSRALPAVVRRPLQVAASARSQAAVPRLAAPSRPSRPAVLSTRSSSGPAADPGAIERSSPGRAGHPAWSPPHTALTPQLIAPTSRATFRSGGADAPDRPEPPSAVAARPANRQAPSPPLFAATAPPETAHSPQIGMSNTATRSGSVSSLERLKARSALVRLGPIEQGSRSFVATASPAPMAPDNNADPVSDLNLYPAASRATASPALRGQAGRIAQAVTPLLQRAAGFQPPAPLDRGGSDPGGAPGTPDMTLPAPVSNVFNVNVSLGTGAESDAFRDALTDVLRDCARRQGLDV